MNVKVPLVSNGLGNENIWDPNVDGQSIKIASIGKGKKSLLTLVLRSQNYLFSAPAPAIYCQ